MQLVRCKQLLNAPIVGRLVKRPCSQSAVASMYWVFWASIVSREMATAMRMKMIPKRVANTTCLIGPHLQMAVTQSVGITV